LGFIEEGKPGYDFAWDFFEFYAKSTLLRSSLWGERDAVEGAFYDIGSLAIPAPPPAGGGDGRRRRDSLVHHGFGYMKSNVALQNERSVMSRSAKKFEKQFSQFMSEATAVKAPAKSEGKSKRVKRHNAFQFSLGF
jgi:hypothetical protein